MKNKKRVVILGCIVLLLAGIGYFVYSQVEISKTGTELTEYTPEAEITGEQLRQTMIALYFNNKDTNTLVPEARNIDVKELTKEPYQTLMNLLIEGPKGEKFERTIPEGTKVNKIELKGNVLWVDVSKEFIENHPNGAEAESRTVYSIVNTMTQLNEVSSVKIVVDGKEDCAFSDNAISLKDVFLPKDETI